MWPARISACKPSQASGERRSGAPRRCGGASSAASAVALPPALNSSHTIAQHLRCLTDPGDPLFLKKTKQSQAIGSGLVTSRFLCSLQLRNIFLDQQRISSVHTQPPVPSTSLILNRDNTLALILIPTLPIFSLCRTSRFIRIGITDLFAGPGGKGPGVFRQG